MHKYWAMYTLGLKNSLEYRGALVTWILVEIMVLTSAVFLWTGVYKTNQHVGSYDYQQMILYYFLVPIVGAITSTHITERLPRKIKDGEISKDIIKPYVFVMGYIINQLAIKSIQNSIKFPVYLVIGYLLFTSFHLSVHPLHVIYGISAAFLGTLLLIALETAISLSAFWFDDTWSLSLLKSVLVMIFGGLSFPLDLIPQSWRMLYSILPFDLVYYFPVSVIMGRTTNTIAFQYGVKFLIWFIGLVFLSRFLWRSGLRKYGAYGQ